MPTILNQHFKNDKNWREKPKKDTSYAFLKKRIEASSKNLPSIKKPYDTRYNKIFNRSSICSIV